MKTMKNKGFTLAELLIVMAVIVVLAAIAIPTFAKQLETARESSDVDAIRAAASSAFSECYTKYVTDSVADISPGTKYYSMPYTVKFTQHESGFQYMTPVIEIGNGEEGTNGLMYLTNTPRAASFSNDNASLPGSVWIQFEFTVNNAAAESAFYLTNVFAGPIENTLPYDKAFYVLPGDTNDDVFADALAVTSLT